MARTSKRDIVRSLYLHVPFCRHLCNYCDFFKKVREGDSQFIEYEARLTESLKALNQFHQENNVSFGSLQTFYLGGGTPSLWGKRGARYLESTFRDNQILFAENAEITLEVNPGAWTKEELDAWEEFGVNRYSVGIQSLNNKMLKVLDRVHDVEEVIKLIDELKRRDANYSVDLMIGLPTIQKRNLEREINELLSFRPKHFSVYILTVGKGYPHYVSLPDDKKVGEEFLQVVDHLQAAGYQHYEVSNFSKKGFESRHNLQYWNSGSVAALGPSATGFYSMARKRLKWKVSEDDFLIESLSSSEMLLEKIYLSLRVSSGISLNDLGDLIPDWSSSRVQDLIEKWRTEELAVFDKNGLRLTSKGMLIMDHLIPHLL